MNFCETETLVEALMFTKIVRISSPSHFSKTVKITRKPYGDTERCEGIFKS